MRIALVSSPVFLFLTLLFSQAYPQAAHFNDYYFKKDNERRSYWERGDYKRAVDVLLEMHVAYQKLTAEEKAKHKKQKQDILYNLACAHSLMDYKSEALRYLRQAVEAGYPY